MKIIGYKDLKTAPSGSVAAIGFFDGVHLAHRKLLSDARELANSLGVPFGILTFSSESNIKKGAPRLYSTEEKIRFFEESSADFSVILDFEEICSLSPEEFVKDILVDGLNASVAYVGYNFRFGKGALGNSPDLYAFMKKAGKDAVICSEVDFEGMPISATLIRTLIESGEIERANALLGSPYFISGEVVQGNGAGHDLGFPTVNTALASGKVIPKRGVYRSAVSVMGKLYNGVTNIGTCPTLGERETHAETYIIDFSENVYGQNVVVYLLGYLREERMFGTAEELIMQIEVDKNKAIKKNGEEKWQELGLK